MTLPRWFPARLAVYALVGASGTLVHYVLFVSLIAAGMRVLAASFCGYVAGAGVNYALNYRITFRSTRPHQSVAPRFFAVALAGLALNLLIVGVLHDGLALRPLLAQLAATAACLLATYTANSLWSFGHDKERIPLQRTKH